VSANFSCPTELHSGTKPATTCQHFSLCNGRALCQACIAAPAAPARCAERRTCRRRPECTVSRSRQDSSYTQATLVSLTQVLRWRGRAAPGVPAQFRAVPRHPRPPLHTAGPLQTGATAVPLPAHVHKPMSIWIGLGGQRQPLHCACAPAPLQHRLLCGETPCKNLPCGGRWTC